MIPKLLIPSAALTAVFAACTASAATVLSGESLGQSPWADNTNIPANYGSNLPGTPNVGLTWSPVFTTPDSAHNGWQAYPGWQSSGGNGAYQMGAGTTGTSYDILFTPDAGYAVVLTSVGLDIWSGGGTNWQLTATVYDSTGTTVLSPAIPLTPSASDPDGNSTWSLGGYTGGDGQALLLRFQIQTATAGHNIAIDNLSFDQLQVPEPSAALLGGLGALALLRRRR